MSKEEFLEKVNITDTCWNWTGFVNPQGYGESYKGGKERAHRLSYKIFKGNIPYGLQLDHLCRNRSCVNPDHLEAVSRRVNILRGTAPSALNAKKTHCSRGHPYKGVNLVLVWRSNTLSWWRQCRKCKTINQRTWRAHKK